jgi:uncharacterized membrane protein YeiH
MQILPADPVVVAGFLVAFDLLGTFVFALSGAVAGIRHRLDLFGVLVLSFAAATAGGMLRDVLIDAGIPAAIRDWRYVAVSMLAGLVTFYRPSGIERWRNAVLWFDAAGLALFAVTGTSKALAYLVNPVSAALLGMLTGIGGGMVRDVLVSEVPTVFRAELYAVTALAGAAVVVAGHLLHLPSGAVATAGAALCFGLRFLGIKHGWRLPLATGVVESTGATHTVPEAPDDDAAP